MGCGRCGVRVLIVCVCARAVRLAGGDSGRKGRAENGRRGRCPLCRCVTPSTLIGRRFEGLGGWRTPCFQLGDGASAVLGRH